MLELGGDVVDSIFVGEDEINAQLQVCRFDLLVGHARVEERLQLGEIGVRVLDTSVSLRGAEMGVGRREELGRGGLKWKE